MEKIIVKKSPPLSGTVNISGSKNASLPILAASLLCNGESVIQNVPALSDVSLMCSLLEGLGAQIRCVGSTVTVSTPKIKSHVAPYEPVSKMRASFLVMGPMLARTGRTRISLPGGCPIGVRPVDLHLKGFAAMGAKITTGHGYVEAKADRLHAANIYLDFPSVGATENLIMAAALAEGQTTIENAATEPEIVDLADYLNRAGARIAGAGSDTLTIDGVSELHGCTYRVIPDRIEAGTFMVAAAVTHGKLEIDNIICDHLKPVSAKLREMGVQIQEDGTRLIADATGKLKSVDIKTLPYPGFPTDMQAQMAALMSTIDGTGVVVETIFENRFLYVNELVRMGAHIKIDGRSAIVEGVKSMSGAPVNATDLRAGAALILAGLAAKGDTEIGSIEHIDRGYDHIVEKLRQVGAKIERK
ncbi:MAG TPA: UDP-N-acetylglucosamine 1-carboxyvinyltransferase [Candidatus Aphodoplasma excrementigallinarum]|uniref:UDP-N-acetylglucosamine 1-carboxyvinyltransferase n=1 Tax=Candidatus Aphodoplasma excrementigallinarum TaxID=2840673 RepID=A0A9D1NHJ0_9FIRM|nr:UDP-N-acetylglucosamine 1-carboxyvinyltransferase [Candidatus Aphodoplasma excrementigallinarum]